MKSCGKFDNHHAMTIRRWIGLVVASCFLLGTIAVAIHNHDTRLIPKKGTLCKAKTLFPRMLSKVKSPTPLTMANATFPAMEIYLSISRINNRCAIPSIPSPIPVPFLNKAPPYVS